MPVYTISAPDGKEYDIEGPVGATEEQLFAVANQSMLQSPLGGGVPDGTRGSSLFDNLFEDKK